MSHHYFFWEFLGFLISVFLQAAFQMIGEPPTLKLPGASIVIVFHIVKNSRLSTQAL